MPVRYWGRDLIPAERNYSATERECLAIVWAILRLRPYLERTRFKIRTDHHALKWALFVAMAEGRLAKWRLRLGELTSMSNIGRVSSIPCLMSYHVLKLQMETPLLWTTTFHVFCWWMTRNMLIGTHGATISLRTRTHATALSRGSH